MRVVVIAVGSRGDVAPFTGLGQRLAAAGHEVSIATHPPFETLVRAAGLGFHPLPVDLRAELDPDLGRGATGASVLSPSRSMRLWRQHYRELGTAILAASRNAEALLLSPQGWLGYHVAEGLRLPTMGVYLQPLTPTSSFPPLTTTRSLGGWGNREAAVLMRSAGQWPAHDAVNELRHELGLSHARRGAMLTEMERTRWPVWYGFSSAVVPAPPDWPSWHRPVGYWWPTVDPGWQPPAELERFLAAGPPPVYVGFGTMRGTKPQAVREAITRAVRTAGARAVVQAGWTDATFESDDVISVDDVPHEWLFARVAAVVHHAGAGTTAAGLRAGVPAVAVPSMVDQPFWAGRLAALGVAPAPIPVRSLSAATLAAALGRVLTDASYADRAAAVAALLAEEDGAAPVVDAVGRLAR